MCGHNCAQTEGSTPLLTFSLRCRENEDAAGSADDGATSCNCRDEVALDCLILGNARRFSLAGHANDSGVFRWRFVDQRSGFEPWRAQAGCESWERERITEWGSNRPIDNHLANSARGKAFPSATQPASLGCKWSPLSYAGSSCVGWLGSRKTASRSTTLSNSVLLRIQSLTF